MTLNHHPRAAVHRNAAIFDRVGKYHDIFENIKNIMIFKYFRYFPENENFE